MTARTLERHGGKFWAAFHILGVAAFFYWDPAAVMPIYAALFAVVEIIGILIGAPMTKYVRRWLNPPATRSFFERYLLFSGWLAWLITSFTLYGWFDEPTNFMIGGLVVGTWMWDHFYGEV